MFLGGGRDRPGRGGSTMSFLGLLALHGVSWIVASNFASTDPKSSIGQAGA